MITTIYQTPFPHHTRARAPYQTHTNQDVDFYMYLIIVIFTVVYYGDAMNVLIIISCVSQFTVSTQYYMLVAWHTTTRPAYCTDPTIRSLTACVVLLLVIFLRHKL